MSFRGYMLLAAGLVFSGAIFSQAQKNSSAENQAPETTSQSATAEKTPVDIMAAKIYNDQTLLRSVGIDERAQILVGEVAFHHNGAVIACDSAVRYYATNRIDCFRNVIINKDSTFVYGDRAEYNGDHNLATVFSPVIKVVDGEAILYTTNQFKFNTSSNTGTWNGGGVIYQKDNVLESERGYFYSDLHEMVAVRNVQMRNDTHELISDSVRYNTETRVADFYTRSWIWTKDGEMISALRGRYNAADSTYFFWNNAYVLDEFRESWADTIDFHARAEDAFFYGNVQIDDREHDSSAFGDFGQYWGARGETMLTRRPSLLNYDADQGNADTLYLRADTIRMWVRYPSDSWKRDSLGRFIVPEGKGKGADAGEDRFAHLRWVDSLSDSVRVAMADSLVPVIKGLRARISDLNRRADSIMEVLYPPEPVAAVEDVIDSLAAGEGVIDSLAAVEQPAAEPEPERTVPPEVAEMRLQALELGVEADSLTTVEGYIRPQLSAAAQAIADSLAQRRVDSLARVDSLHRVDSIRTADPKAYRALQKMEARRLKAERQRLAAEAREAKYAAKAAAREEKARIRAEKRAAKAAAKAARIAARRRSFRRRPGDAILDSLAHRDSLTVVDSMRLVDSPARIDSLWRLDSLARVDSLPAADSASSDSTFRIFRGWHNVRIYRKDMQAVSDSMAGFSTDSTVRLYIDPVLWHADNQVTADSVVLFTANQQIEHAEFFGNPIMASQIGGSTSRQFNQVKGRHMAAWFRDGAIHRHDVNENAQALYYVQEEEEQEEEEQEDGSTAMSEALAFVVTSSANMSFFFENDSLRYIAERQKVLYTAYPMDQIPGTQPTRLQGFAWRIERRPTVGDVFDRHRRPSEREVFENRPHPDFPIAARIERRKEYLTENRMWADRSDPLPAYAIEFRRARFRESQTQ